MEQKPFPFPALSKRAAKDLRALHARKGRLASGLFLVESPKAIVSFLESGWIPQTVVGTDAGWNTLRAVRWEDRNTEKWIATEAAMSEASALDTPSSLLAVFQLPDSGAPQPATRPNGIQVVLDGVRDPGNLGTIIRLADWFAANAVWLSEDSADPFQPKVVQASMGSLARVPVFRGPLVDRLNAWKEQGLPVCAADLDGTTLAQQTLSLPLVLVLGNEGKGLSPEVKRCCTEVLTIPRSAPGAESLNVATAAAIMLYELRR